MPYKVAAGVALYFVVLFLKFLYVVVADIGYARPYRAVDIFNAL